jgi:ribosomal protein L35
MRNLDYDKYAGEIRTKYVSNAAGRGGIKASHGETSLTTPYDHALSSIGNHRAAAVRLARKEGYSESAVALEPSRQSRGGYYWPVLRSARESNPGRKHIHTAKFERCVRDVSKLGTAKDPYAVCTAGIGYKGSLKAGHRRRNPARGWKVEGYIEGAERPVYEQYVSTKDAAERLRDRKNEEANRRGWNVKFHIRETSPHLTPRRYNPARSEADEIAGRELEIFAESEGTLYNQKKSIIKNLQLKMARGQYDPAKAARLWEYWLENAAKLYTRQIAGGGSWSDMFSASTRRWAAKRIEAHERGRIERDEYGLKHELPKKYRTSNPIRPVYYTVHAHKGSEKFWLGRDGKLHRKESDGKRFPTVIAAKTAARRHLTKFPSSRSYRFEIQLAY